MKAVIFTVLLILMAFAVQADGLDDFKISVSNGVFNYNAVHYGLMAGTDKLLPYNETYYLYSRDDGVAYQALVSYFLPYDFTIDKFFVGVAVGGINQFKDGSDSRGSAYRTRVGYNYKWLANIDLSFHYFPANEDMWYLGIGITRL